MPRHKRFRKLINPPHFRGFMPMNVPAGHQTVIIDFEEYEAIRLCDFDMYNHAEACRIMNVSRPTFARIYENARQKVANAFVQGLPIIFEGGKVYFDSDWYSCDACSCIFNHLDKHVPVKLCALCGSENIKPVEYSQPSGGGEHVCVCPACGHRQPVRRGVPCSHASCEKCSARMRRDLENNNV